MSKVYWLPEHADQLKRLRLTAGIEIATLAKKHLLSSLQIIQLEESGNSTFHSPEIKYNVGRKLIRSLGEEITGVSVDGTLSTTTLERIPSLISRNFQLPTLNTSFERNSSMPKWWWSAIVAILATLVMAWYGMAGNSRPKKIPVDTKEQSQMAQPIWVQGSAVQSKNEAGLIK